MTCTCPPAIDAEMADWIKLGGSNSGCCGNNKHTYGFHRAADELPGSDYSLRHDSGRPVNGSWASAGDFAHNGNARLRAVHADVLARLMAGDPRFSMICEFIGMPWANRPVYYWCRWAGVSTLQRYTGAGHTTWSHISWWRSKGNQRPYLYVAHAPVPSGPAVTPVSTYPRYGGHELRQGATGAPVKTWQARMQVRGWSIAADARFGPATASVVRTFQAEKHLTVDGVIGPKTWAAAWTFTITG